jgi:hypothetical protein
MMRSATSLSMGFLLTLAALVSSARAQAPDSTAAVGVPLQAAAADSTAATVPSTPASSPSSITVFLKNGKQRVYDRVEPWPGDFVRASGSDGSVDYISVHDIAKITGDVTNTVLGRRVPIGETPESKAKEEGGMSSLRGRPLPDAKFFPVIQAGVMARLDDTRSYESTGHTWFDLGGMVNLSPKVAFGGTVGVASDYDYSRITLKPRLRRWLGRGMALDVAPGVFFPSWGTLFNYSPDLLHGPVGFTGEVALSVKDLFSVAYMVEAIDQKLTYYLPGSGIPFYTVQETDVSHYLGIKAGGRYGLMGTVLMVAALFAEGS